MDAPRDDDPDDPRFGTAEWDHRLEERRGHPTGRHVRQHDDEGPPRVSEYLREGRAADLRSMVREMMVGVTPPPAPVDWWKHASILIGAAGLALTIIGSAIAIVQSNTRLYDKVETIDGRVATLEKSRVDNLPRLDQTIAENKSQADTINSIRESIAEERKQRGADGIENRKALTDIMAIISKLADKVADIDKTVAVMAAPGRRSDAGTPEHDAQLAPRQSPR